MSYHWPGNIRELENTVERAVLVCDGNVIHGHHLPPTLQTAEASGTVTNVSFKESGGRLRKRPHPGHPENDPGNRAKAATHAKTTDRIINYKIKKLQIDWKRFQTHSRPALSTQLRILTDGVRTRVQPVRAIPQPTNWPASGTSASSSASGRSVLQWCRILFARRWTIQDSAVRSRHRHRASIQPSSNTRRYQPLRPLRTTRPVNSCKRHRRASSSRLARLADFEVTSPT